MSRWYRAYAGTIKDDKLAEVAVIAGCSRSVAIAVWHAILESAAETEDGGRFETTPRRVAAALCEPLPVIQAAFDAMTEIAMIGSDSVTAWKARQYESDKSTSRVRKHRETLQGRFETPPDTETDTDKAQSLPETKSPTPNVRSIGKPMRPARDELQERFWKAYPSRGEAANPKAPALEKFARAVKAGADPEEIIAAAARYAEVERKAGRIGTEKVAQALTWLNQRRWGDYPAAAPPSESQSSSDVFVPRGTEAWEAWVAHGMKPWSTYCKIKREEGRYLPSEFPPGHVPSEQYDTWQAKGRAA